MRPLRILVPAAAVVAFLLAALGSWIRVHGPRLACNDWPLCRGSLVPPPGDAAAAIEWTHRLLASLEGLLLLTIFVLAWPLRRCVAGLGPALLAVLAAIVLQIALGAATVLMTNPVLEAVLHWAVGTSLLGALLAATIVLWTGELPEIPRQHVWAQLTATAGLAFVAMCIGSYLGAAHDVPPAVATLHRFVAGSFIVLAVLVTIECRKSGSPNVRKTAALGLALAFAQACLGIAQIRLGLPPAGPDGAGYAVPLLAQAHALNATLTFLAYLAATTFAAVEPAAGRQTALAAQAVAV